MATPREAEMLTDGLADNFAASIQNTRNDSGVKLRGIPLQDRGAIHHWYASHAHIVLDGDPFARQNTAWSALDRAPLVPGIQRVLLGLWTVAATTRILHG